VPYIANTGKSKGYEQMDRKGARVMPTEKAVFLCGGNPKCFGNPGCGLCGRGECYATTDIQCARNKVTLLNHGSESGDRLWKMVMSPLIEAEE